VVPETLEPSLQLAAAVLAQVNQISVNILTESSAASKCSQISPLNQDMMEFDGVDLAGRSELILIATCKYFYLTVSDNVYVNTFF
jgi:hypothetical protein